MLSHTHIGQTVAPAAPRVTQASEPLTPGVVQARRTAAARGQHEYFLYVPSSAPDARRLFITVHGISRNAREHARRFAKFAEAQGVVVVAPRFAAARYPDYQRLGRVGRGEHAGAALHDIVEEVALLTAIDDGQLFLFGYSGGAQFVHRFVMAYPGRVARYAVAAAGWYTFPDKEQRYPMGIKRSRSQGNMRFRASRFLHIPALVVVGERDTVQNGKLRETPRVVAHQGPSRLERGRLWVQAMNEAARERGLATRFEFAVLPDSRHLFKQCMRRGDMGQRVFDFLFDGEATA